MGWMETLFIVDLLRKKYDLNSLPFIILDGPASLAGDSNMASASVSLILSSSSSLPRGLVTVDSAQLLYTSHRLGDWSKLPGEQNR